MQQHWGISPSPVSAGARLIYSLINETAVTPHKRALPTASQPACHQLVPSLCLRHLSHSCAWVGSQLDHDPAQIYAPVYLSALETICGQDAFEAAEPAAGRSLQGGRALSFALSHPKTPVREGHSVGTGLEGRAGNPARPGTVTSLGGGKTCERLSLPERCWVSLVLQKGWKLLCPFQREWDLQRCELSGEDNPRAYLVPDFASHSSQRTVAAIQSLGQDGTLLQQLLLPGREGCWGPSAPRDFAPDGSSSWRDH